MDSWTACHEFEPSTTEDMRCRVGNARKIRRISKVIQLVWCGVEVRRGSCYVRCRPRHLSMVQNDEVRREKSVFR
ncbi:hypothetical protein TNCV_3257671 [Trichonephila clavipes]|nr:hypothetical protein TNCV_3257671 [Trichonephila clavipes]